MTFINKLVVFVSLLFLLASGLVSGFCIGGLTGILELIEGSSSGGHGPTGLGNLFFGALLGTVIAIIIMGVTLFRYPPRKKNIKIYSTILTYSFIFALLTVAFTFIKVNHFGGWGWG